MKFPTCPVCGSAAAKAYKKAQALELIKCDVCALVSLFPFPSAEQLMEIYSKEYYDSWGGRDKEALVTQQKHAHFTPHLKRISEVKNPGSKLLDLGCAKGDFVQMSLNAGYDSHGIELSEHSAKIAADKVGADRIENCTLLDTALPQKSLDVITMFDFLEHVPNLQETLQMVSSLLKDDGILYLVTPDSGSLSYKLMGGRWWHFKQEHLYYFNSANLQILLKRFGLSHMASGSCSKTLSLEYLTNQLRHYPVPVFTQMAKVLDVLLPQQALKQLITLPSGEVYFLAHKTKPPG
jgi:2-polyprenyl-3-methyl-5-hydroxy-6-metoxy-1,4-benzoquinol methylase